MDKIEKENSFATYQVNKRQKKVYRWPYSIEVEYAWVIIKYEN